MSQRWAYFDVDDTLVLWAKPEDTKRNKKIKILDPSSGAYVAVWIHSRHVELLKLIHSHGDTIVVWSSAGALWAQSVVNALALGGLVSYCIQKPDTLYDDLEPQQWMPMFPRWEKS